MVVCTGFAGRATRRLAKASAESRTGQTTVEAMVVVLQCWGGRTQVGANSQARLARGQRAVAGRGHGLRWLQTGQFGWIKLGRHGSSSPSGLRCPLRVLRGGQGVQRRSPADRHSQFYGDKGRWLQWKGYLDELYVLCGECALGSG